MSNQQDPPQAKAIIDEFAKYTAELDALKSPHTLYAETMVGIRARIAHLWKRQSPLNPDEQDEIVTLGGRLRELEINHEATIQAEEQVYQEALQATLDRLCRDMILVLGPTRVETCLRALSQDEGRQCVDGPATSLESPAPTSRGSTRAELPGPAGNVPNDKRKSSLPNPPARHKRRRFEKTTTQEGEADTATCGSRSHQEPTRPEASSIEVEVEVPRRQTRHSHRHHDNTTGDQDCEGITNPDLGNVYLAFWQKSKEWLAVLVLPLQNLEDAGVSGTLESLGLTEEIPACYKMHHITGKLTLQNAFKDGQPRVNEREFPVMYFDGQDFPEKSAVGWVAAKDLRAFDLEATNTLVPHIRSVQKFLKARDAGNITVRVEEVEDKAVQEEKQAQQQGQGQENGAEETTGRTDLTDVASPSHNSCSPVPDHDRRPSDGLETVPSPAHLSGHDSHSSIEPHPQPDSQPISHPTPQPDSRPTPQRTPRTVSQTTPQVAPQPVTAMGPESSHHGVDGVEPKQEHDIEVISIASTEPEEELDDIVHAPVVESGTTLTETAPQNSHSPVPTQESHNQEEASINAQAHDVGPGMLDASRLAQAALDASCLAAPVPDRGPPAHWNYAPPYLGQDQGQVATTLPQASPSTTQAMGPEHVPHASLRYPNAEELALPAAQSRPWNHGQILQPPTLGTRPATHSMHTSLDHGPSQGSLINPTPPEFRSGPSVAHLPPQNMAEPSTTFGTSTDSLILPPISSISRPDMPPRAPFVTGGGDAPTSNTPVGYFPGPQSQGASATQQNFQVHQMPTTGNRTTGQARVRSINEWPYELSDKFVSFLELYQKRNGRPIGIDGFKDSYNRYTCPICREPKVKPYCRLGSFTQHLVQHWNNNWLTIQNEVTFGLV